jgi:hypothetical protein
LPEAVLFASAQVIGISQKLQPDFSIDLDDELDVTLIEIISHSRNFIIIFKARRKLFP